MKKYNLILAVCILAMIGCMACSNKAADYTASSEEIVVPEDVEIPSAAQAIEKIINDEDVIDLPIVQDEELTGDDEEIDEKVSVSIFYVQSNYDEFKIDVIEMDTLTPEAIVSALSLHNIVPVDIAVDSFELTENEDGETGINLLLSDKFEKYLTTMSDDAECAIVASVSNTFLEAYDAKWINVNDYEKTWCEVPVPVDPSE